LQQLSSEYRQGLKTLPRNKVQNLRPQDLAELLHAGALASPSSLPDDVLHDLLSFLAGEMTALNEEKKAETKLFFRGWKGKLRSNRTRTVIVALKL